MKNLWEVWPSAITPEYCDYIIAQGQKKPAHAATVGLDANGEPVPEIRSSTIRWLDPEGEEFPIADYMMKFVKKSNKTNFGFDIYDIMNEIQFTEYHGTENGKYNWHHDVFFDQWTPSQRKLSIVVQLSDPNDYDGGQFEFFNMPCPGEEFKGRGSVLVFPSFFEHRVLPVTRGLRMSAVSWIEGPAWR